ncbi:zinc ribbon domain-containing protein [Oribacterium sp. WCC10]|uniref:zinc ribbon domain-containing protein n=1 Tax=Oribacterium sp. WCC10 TaxID=1855343 RepID=UPI0008E6D6A0|nr:zinc ribbon domain-containing protein [Oribacterium sp. WCC10]SFG06737.1 hypothetical protein SAMN05216356_10172 [Oribacterium sp. WCC10]
MDWNAIVGPLLTLAVFGIIVTYITYRVRRFRRSIMGQAIETIAKAMVTGEGVIDEAEATARPKSLASMDSIYVPRIERDFPEFSWDEWKTRIQNAVVLRMEAIDKREPELLNGYPEVMREVESLITNDSVVSSGRAYSEDVLEYKSRYAYKTVVAGYEHGDGICTIHAQTSASYERRVKVGTKSNSTGESSTGWQMRKFQSVFNTDLVYVQDEKKTDGKMRGYTCPNCGAPVTGLGTKICAYCGTGLEGMNLKVWRINRIWENRK